MAAISVCVNLQKAHAQMGSTKFGIIKLLFYRHSGWQPSVCVNLQKAHAQMVPTKFGIIKL